MQGFEIFALKSTNNVETRLRGHSSWGQWKWHYSKINCTQMNC